MLALISRNIKMNKNIIIVSILIIVLSYFLLAISKYDFHVIKVVLSGSSNQYQNIFLMSISFSINILFIIHALNLKRKNRNYMLFLRINKLKINLCVVISLLIIDTILLGVLKIIINIDFFLILLTKLSFQIGILILFDLWSEMVFFLVLLFDYIINNKSIIFHLSLYNQASLILIYGMIIAIELFILLKKDRRK